MRIRTVLLSFLSGILFCTTASAQKSGFRSGLWAGFGTATSTDVRGRLSYGIGADLSLFAGRFALVARPALDRRGYRSGKESSGSVLKVNASYFDIPVLLEYGFTSGMGNAVFIGAGGYYGLAFSGNYRYNKDAKKSLSFGEDSTDNRSRQDMGLVFSAGYRIEGGAKVGLQAMFSTNDVIPDARQVPGGKEQRLSAFYIFVSIPFHEFRGK